MIDPLNALEAELAAWQPRQPSAALQEKLRTSLEQPVRRQPRRALLVTSGLAAAVLLTFLMIQPARFTESSVAIVQAINQTDAAPSLHNYARAYAQSPEALDALLQRHALEQQMSHSNTIQISSRHFTPLR